MADRYIVETEFKPDVRSVLYHGNNYERAKETANFWDERQDTWLIDMALLSPLDRAMRLFDQAIFRLETQKEYMPKLRATLRRPSPFAD